ncbi:MAG: hypothetical protein U1E86_07695 [Burkholderiaceae bacterium]
MAETVVLSCRTGQPVKAPEKVRVTRPFWFTQDDGERVIAQPGAIVALPPATAMEAVAGLRAVRVPG